MITTHSAAAWGMAPRATARTAGFLYLIVIGCGIFAEFFVRGAHVVAGDAAATAANLLRHAYLFRVGMATDLIAQVSYFLVGYALYTILKTVHKNLALMCLLLTAISTGVTCLNMLNQYAALAILTGDLGSFEMAQRQDLALFFLGLHKEGYLIAQLFFGGWLFPLGWLVYRSGYFPKVLGILLMIACTGYLADLFMHILIPEVQQRLAPVTLPLVALAESSFCLWLLVKGANVPATLSAQSAS